MTTLEKRLHYYRIGLNDIEIAKLQDVTPAAVQKWRMNRKLKSNEQVGGNRNQWGRAGKPGGY